MSAALELTESIAPQVQLGISCTACIVLFYLSFFLSQFCPTKYLVFSCGRTVPLNR